MFAFWNRRKREEEAREAELQLMRQSVFKKIDETSKKIDKASNKQANLIHVLDSDDIALKIFYATGGDRRGKK